MTDAPAAPPAPNTKAFPDGAYVLWRKSGWRPRRRHDTFDAAETEAKRLLGLQGGTVVILQEVARVKVEDASAPGGGVIKEEGER